MSRLPGRKKYKEAMQAAPVDPIKRRADIYAIGVDPGDFTGIAVFHRKENRLAEIHTLDFWRAYWHIVNNYQPFNCTIYVETTKHLKIYKRHRYVAKLIGQRKGEHAERGTLTKITRDVGGVVRETELLIRGLRLAGFDVVESGVADKDTWTEQFFQSITKYDKPVTQHARDATSLCWGR